MSGGSEDSAPIASEKSGAAKMLELAPRPSKSYRWINDPLLLFCGLAAALLLGASLKEQELGFYTFLRIYVCGLSVLLSWHFWRQQKFALMLLAAVAATLFNPVLPVELEQEDWQWFDLAAAGGFISIAVSGLARSIGRPKLIFAALVPVALLGLARLLGDNWPQFAAAFPGGHNSPVENTGKNQNALFDEVVRDIALKDKCGGLHSQNYVDARRILRARDFPAKSEISSEFIEGPACLTEYCRQFPEDCRRTSGPPSSGINATPAPPVLRTPSAWIGSYDATFDRASGEVKIREVDNQLSVSMLMAAEQCTGELKFTVPAPFTDVLLHAFPLDSGGTRCSIRMTRRGKSIAVKETSCFAFHGAECAFNGLANPKG